MTPPQSRRHFAARTNWNLETNRLSAALTAHRVAGKPLLDLAESNPTRCGFRYDQDAILRALASPSSLVYEPEALGLASARQAVAGYYAQCAEPVTAGDVLLTTGTSEAYSFALRLLCDPGAEILVPSPSYPLFDFLADLQDVKIVRYPLQYDYGWQIDFAALESVITPKTRAIIVVNPNNPTGNFCSLEEVARLNEICARRELALIVDEVFLDFVLDEPAAPGSDPAALPRPRSFVSNRENLTFTMSGISKICGLPQMKLAWLVTSGPAELKSDALARLDVIADTFLSMNTPVQHAASALLAQRTVFQEQLMDRVRKNLAELDCRLAAQESCWRLRFQGGWYAVLRVPQTSSDEDLAIGLLNRRDVYLHPGHFYDFPGEGYFVVSLIVPQPDFEVGISSLLLEFP